MRDAEVVDSAAGEEAIRRVLLDRAREMDLENPPIRFEYLAGQVQLVHYDESKLARMIRLFPFVQLLFVSLFVLVDTILDLFEEENIHDIEDIRGVARLLQHENVFISGQAYRFLNRLPRQDEGIAKLLNQYRVRHNLTE